MKKFQHRAVAAACHRPARTPALNLSLCLGVCLGLTAPPLLAQDTPASDSNTEQGTLQKVVVTGARQSTATRLPMTRRETPQSVSVVDRQRIDQETMLSINDVMSGITGVNVTFYDSQRPLYFARGFQITDFRVDGMLTYSGSTNQEYDMALYERVSVVRGANGVLTGTGVPSAVVDLQRKRPGRKLAASAAVTTGSWDYLRGEADLNLPLTQDGRWRSRMVVAAQDRKSFRDRYREDKLAWLAALEADLTPDTTVTLGYQSQDNNPQGAIWGTIPRFASDGTLAGLPRSTSFSPRWTRWDRESGTAYLQLEQAVGETWMLKAQLNRTKGDLISERVYGSGFPDPVNGGGMKLLAAVGQTEETLDAVDVHAAGPFELFGRRHDLVVGADASKLRSFSPTLSSVSSWSYVIPDLTAWDGDIPGLSYRRTGASRVARTEQQGVYANARWRVSDPLALITGVRISSWKTGTDNFNASGANTGTTGAYKVDNEVTPFLGLSYQISPAWSVYGSYASVFKPQNNKDKDNNLLAPVEGSNLEAGIKGALLGGRIEASAAIFQTRQDNFAVRDSTQPDNSLPDGSSAFIGVDGTRSRGIEFDLSGQVRPGWFVQGGFTHVSVKRHANDLIYANLPQNYLQLSTSVQLPGALSRFTLGGGVNWQSKVLGFNIPHPTLGRVTVKQGSYALVNLHLNYRISDHVQATLSVRNALDKAYWANLDYPNYGEPRNVTLALKWRL